MRRRSVALLIETSNAYARGLLEGIVSYTRTHDSWSIYLPEQERGARPPDWLTHSRIDGIIARIETDEIAATIREHNVPTVDVSAARRVPDIPWVETDDAEIARLAVGHLLERGFRSLAYCGEPDFNWSEWRREHFERIATEHGCKCHVFQSVPRNSPDYAWQSEQKRMAAWVRRLPKPTGVLACYDIKAQQLLDVCRGIDIAVPEKLAVLGVDDDSLLCNLCDPPLSSIAPDAHKTGYTAASLLDQLMSGTPPPDEAFLIPPLGIETRLSTDTLAVDDPDIAAALHFIRENACSGINVSDVVRQTSVSRRVLESRFNKLLGRSPHAEITRLRIDRIKRLLVETDLPLSAIAARTGYRHVEYLSVAFRNAVGIPPTEHRRRSASSRK
ncbi:helix-turn-helix domain-containing protein [bacterium]|nr:helix-turn-helix domain-containing protein [bacterium]